MAASERSILTFEVLFLESDWLDIAGTWKLFFFFQYTQVFGINARRGTNVSSLLYVHGLIYPVQSVIIIDVGIKSICRRHSSKTSVVAAGSPSRRGGGGSGGARLLTEVGFPRESKRRRQVHDGARDWWIDGRWKFFRFSLSPSTFTRPLHVLRDRPRVNNVSNPHNASDYRVFPRGKTVGRFTSRVRFLRRNHGFFTRTTIDIIFFLSIVLNDHGLSF